MIGILEIWIKNFLHTATHQIDKKWNASIDMCNNTD